jgi:uncharacterized protein (DUF433 family)
MVMIGLTVMKARKSASHVIESDPDVLGGKPVVAGTRIPVTIIFDMAGLGYTVDQIVEQYPTLTKDVIIAVLKTGSFLQDCLKHVDLHEYLANETIDQ